MPNLPPSSSDSPQPSATRSDNPIAEDAVAPPRAQPLRWRMNLWLFLATVVSVFVTWIAGSPITHDTLIEGAQYAGALLTILLAHEFGHYVATRIHKVDASLPYFIPMPILSPFGTMGAVIRMRSVIPTRKALLDIGASGPLAGLAFAIPIYLWGIAHSKVIPTGSTGDGAQLGESLLTRLLDKVATIPDTPSGTTMLLSPIAFAAWSGMFVTMINLLPIGQLDGGHVAYALFGPRQNRIAPFVHRAVLTFFFVSLASYVARDVRAGLGISHLGTHVQNSLFWLVWFEMLAVLSALSQVKDDRDSHDGATTERTLTVRQRITAVVGLIAIAMLLQWLKAAPIAWLAWLASVCGLLVMERLWGVLRASNVLDHPPTGHEPLGLGRVVVAVVTLVFFALLFMPTPISM